MSKWQIEFHPQYISMPLSYWVHRQPEGELWSEAVHFEPPLPRPVAGKGYPLLRVDALGSELLFSSVQEVEHFLEVFRQKNLPTSTQLSRKRTSRYGPNRHWLSRLPSDIKPWAKRQKIIPVLEKALAEFRALYT